MLHSPICPQCYCGEAPTDTTTDMASPEAAGQYILGFDPGRDKCGLALVGRDRRLHHRQVVASAHAVESVNQLAQTFPLELVVLGDQTLSQHWHRQLSQALPQHLIVTVNERNSSREARDRYWDYHPPRGWNWLLPRGMRVPPTPYDDIVALILVERFLDEVHAA